MKNEKCSDFLVQYTMSFCNAVNLVHEESQRLMACYNGLQVERVDIRLYYWVSVPFPHIQYSLVVMCMHMCSHFQTKATDVDFWSIDAIELELMHKERIYPPRFQIHAYATRCMCTPIFFQGTAEDITVELLLKPANSGITENCNVCRYLYRIVTSINFIEIEIVTEAFCDQDIPSL